MFHGYKTAKGYWYSPFNFFVLPPSVIIWSGYLSPLLVLIFEYQHLLLYTFLSSPTLFTLSGFALLKFMYKPKYSQALLISCNFTVVHDFLQPVLCHLHFESFLCPPPPYPKWEAWLFFCTTESQCLDKIALVTARILALLLFLCRILESSQPGDAPLFSLHSTGFKWLVSPFCPSMYNFEIQ